MKNFERLYFPLHYKWVDTTAEMTDEEFGSLIRALLSHFFKGEEPEWLPREMRIAYRFILDAAERMTEERERNTEHGKRMAAARWGEKGSASGEREKYRAGNFDPDEAFARALERSYGKSISVKKEC